MGIDSQTNERIRLSDGRWLAYAQYGDPAGKPLLYFHGGMSAQVDVAFASESCEQLGVRIIAPNRPGVGTSTRKRNRSLLDWSDDVEQLITRLQLPVLPLLGWSLAGPYALACAYKLPHLFTRIGTIGGIAPPEFPGFIDQLGLLIDRILLTWTEPWLEPLSVALGCARFVPRSWLKMEMLRQLKSAPDRAIIKSMSVNVATQFVLESIHQGGYGIVDDYRAVSKPWGFPIEQITSKVILWQGEEDLLCPMDGARYMAEHIPNARIIPVPEQGHFLLHNKLNEILAELL